MSDAFPPVDDTHTSAERRLHRIFLEQVREMAREGGVIRPLSDQDAERVLEHFFGQEVEHHPLPPEDTPEFLAELQRRDSASVPALSPKTVAAFLNS